MEVEVWNTPKAGFIALVMVAVAVIVSNNPNSMLMVTYILNQNPPWVLRSGESPKERWVRLKAMWRKRHRQRLGQKARKRRTRPHPYSAGNSRMEVGWVHQRQEVWMVERIAQPANSNLVAARFRE